MFSLHTEEGWHERVALSCVVAAYVLIAQFVQVAAYVRIAAFADGALPRMEWTAELNGSRLLRYPVYLSVSGDLIKEITFRRSWR
jgi:hypothetical protein